MAQRSMKAMKMSSNGQQRQSVDGKCIENKSNGNAFVRNELNKPNVGDDKYKIYGLWKTAGESPSEIYTPRTGVYPEKYG